MRFALCALTASRLLAGRPFRLGLLNTCVSVRAITLLAVLLLTSVAQSSDTDSEVYIPPIDIRLELAQLSPLYDVSQELRPWQDTQPLIDDYAQQNMLPPFEFNEPPKRGLVTVFYLLQALDVYSTYYATSKFKCVREVNPLLPDKPSVEQMMLLKLLPVVAVQNSSQEELEAAVGMYTVVLANNYDVIQSAKKTCR